MSIAKLLQICAGPALRETPCQAAQFWSKWMRLALETAIADRHFKQAMLLEQAAGGAVL
jgi:hypothetical protein